MNVREAIEDRDLDAFCDVLAPDVVWVGRYPGELCRNREEVLEMLRESRGRGVRPVPEIVREAEDALVVDPHLDGRHHVISVRDGLVSEVRAYLSREAALEAVEGRPW